MNTILQPDGNERRTGSLPVLLSLPDLNGPPGPPPEPTASSLDETSSNEHTSCEEADEPRVAESAESDGSEPATAPTESESSNGTFRRFVVIGSLLLIAWCAVIYFAKDAPPEGDTTPELPSDGRAFEHNHAVAEGEVTETHMDTAHGDSSAINDGTIPAPTYDQAYGTGTENEGAPPLVIDPLQVGIDQQTYSNAAPGVARLLGTIENVELQAKNPSADNGGYPIQ